MTLSSVLALGLSFVVAFGAAASGAIFKPGPWYERLRKPSWTPPNWMFPVVWTTLFTMMAIAAWLVWREAGPAAWPALALYAGHLVLNAAWSYLFFGRRRLDWGMIEVVLLWLSVGAVIFAFDRYSETAAWLLLPYHLWVTVAALLNLRLLRMNGPTGEQAAA